MADKKFYLFASIIVGATILSYALLPGNDFINFDDLTFIVDNHHVNTGLKAANTVWAFTASLSSNWQPLTWISHMLDVELFGVDPTATHLVNLFFHMANALLVFHFLAKATGSLTRSAVVGLLFAVHPLHVESVAWAAERKDVLCAFFLLLALEAYRRYAVSNSFRSYLLVLVLFICSLLSKPMAVTFPFLLLLVDYWPFGRIDGGVTGRGWSRAALEKVPLFFLSLACSVATLSFQDKGKSVAPFLWEHAANAVLSYGLYLKKFFWPTGLSIFYPLHTDTAFLKGVGAFFLLAAITCLVVRQRFAHRFAVVGWLWYLGMLVPVIGFIQVGGQAMADRYMYLPSIGLLLLLVWWGGEAAGKYPAISPVLKSFAVIAVIVLVTITYVTVSHWKNSETLYEHALKVTENNWLAHRNLGSFYVGNRLYDKALPHLRQSLLSNPDQAGAYNELAIIDEASGRPDRAIYWYSLAIRLEPGNIDAHHNIALAYLSNGDGNAAQRHLEVLRRLDPEAAVTLAREMEQFPRKW